MSCCGLLHCSRGDKRDRLLSPVLMGTFERPRGKPFLIDIEIHWLRNFVEYIQCRGGEEWDADI